MTETTKNPFVHLRVHSEFSLVDGICRIPELIKSCQEKTMPAMGITEAGNLFSTVKFYKAAQSAGIKPIIGADLRLVRPDNDKEYHAITLLCQDVEGYRNLNHLISRSYREGQIQGMPFVNTDWLQGHTDRLIALSGAQYGEVGKAIITGNADNAARLLDEYRGWFPDRYYLELIRTESELDEQHTCQAVDFSVSHAVPAVATNNVRFTRAEDFEAHEARICIYQGYALSDSRRPKSYTEQQYIKTPEQMQELFADIPEAIENTSLIAQRCNLELTLGEHYLPDFSVPEGFDQAGWLRHHSAERLQNILDSRPIPEHLNPEDYHQRLDVELDVIIQMGFPGYFLIVADFIQWGKDNGIPVGPGRGSGAGSLVAYAMGITELDPLQYDLLFERFLNPERVSLPDFDVDFCMERRDEVIDYVARKYGRDHVSQIITYGTMAAKAVVRDVGRVLGYPYGFVDAIAKLIPFEIGMTLDKALSGEEQLQERYLKEEEVRTLIDLAKKLEGVSRNAGKHAGGIVIAPKPLDYYVPLYCEQGSQSIVSQFDMNDVEAVGMVKFDFLGLRTLTIIDWAIRDVNIARKEQGEAPLEIIDIPLDDPATYKLVQRMETTAVFQLESDGMKKLVGRLKPDKFDDLIALVALFRPGPLQSGMVDDYVDRKHGRARVDYPHPDLEPILQPTYGVILYQEQVMQIAQVLANYSLGGADLLRRAMGKKKPEEMEKQRKIFTEGAVARDVEEKTATYIFDLMEKFAGYGFNKSHSAAYALVAYQTAWLKAHHPAAFMAAVLSSDMDNTDKVVMLLEEMRQMKLQTGAPDINNSAYYFSVADEKTIRYGLGAIKGVGESAIESILGEREENGPYSDLFDLCRRINLQKANRRVLEALIACGALDKLGPSRSILNASLDKAIQLAEQHNENLNAGQDDFFGFAALDATAQQHTDSDQPSEFVEAADWSSDTRLQKEKETLGFYLTGHPIEKYQQEIDSFTSCRLSQVKLGDSVLVAGFIHRARIRSFGQGKLAELVLDDRTSHTLVKIFPKVYEEFRDLILKDHLVVVSGNVETDDFAVSGYAIVVTQMYHFEQYRANHASLMLRIPKEMSGNSAIQSLNQMLSPYRNGPTQIFLEYHNGTAYCRLRFDEPSWKIRLNEALLNSLKEFLGEKNVALNYR